MRTEFITRKSRFFNLKLKLKLKKSFCFYIFASQSNNGTLTRD